MTAICLKKIFIAKETLLFDWLPFQVIQIIPAKGTLEPMKSCLCLVSFVAVGRPSFYDMDLVCEVRNERSLF